MILVWFLILANWNGGVLAIEQRDSVECQAAAQWMNGHHQGMTIGATCVQGVRP